MQTLILGLTVAAVALSLAAAFMARMRRRALERIISAWESETPENGPEGGDVA